MMADLGTLNGKPISSEMLDGLSADFEATWTDSEVDVSLTDRGKALRALQALNMPIEEIEALERKAQHEQSTLPLFLRTILREKLTA
ncbi:MAG: hypothetical protein LBJ48_05070 [Coriobacteriales bacterium]|jgi:hypothetical protein|nr:hypothetical protein [Coriobacteriales bacterium]